jgi:16S rRNA C967 or C1407 C5-methylase (RsmB/RsmF family)
VSSVCPWTAGEAVAATLTDRGEWEHTSTIPWYPDENGYQWALERRKVRKLPLLAEFQKWLVELSNSGSITRQEAVSMIPPLLLDVEPHHKVSLITHLSVYATLSPHV